VGNLAFSTTESELRDLFAQHGTVAEVFIAMDKFSGRSRGFAFVTMGSDAEAKAAITGVNGKNVGGRDLTVNEARRKKRVAGAPSAAAAVVVVAAGPSAAAAAVAPSAAVVAAAIAVTKSSRFPVIALFRRSPPRASPFSLGAPGRTHLARICVLYFRVFSLRITACATFSGPF